MKKPITPLLHGILDYGLIASLFTVPELLNVNRKAINIFRLLGTNLGIYNAVSDHGTGVIPLIPFKTHYKIDYFNVAAVALLGLNKNIRKDKTALLFHAAFLSLSTLNILLTDPKVEKPMEEEEEDDYDALYI